MRFYSSDLNVIYSFVNIRHKFHDVVITYLNSIKEQKYVLLDHVKTVFIFSYQDNLMRIGEIIIVAVNKVKDWIKKRRLIGQPGPRIKNIRLKKELDSLIKEQQDKEVKPTDYTYYEDILLKDYPLIELLDDKEKLKDFETFYIEKAEEITRNKLTEFIEFFDFVQDNLKLNPTNVKKWYDELSQLRKENENLFVDYHNEDIKLSSEYITYCNDRRIPLNFFSTDKNLCSSLNFVKKEKNLNCGDIIFLLSE